MASTLTDDFARALCIHQTKEELDIVLRSLDKRQRAANDFFLAYKRLQAFDMQGGDAIPRAILGELAASHFPALVSLFLDSRLYLFEDDFAHFARLLFSLAMRTPSFGRLIRDHPTKLKGLFHRFILLLTEKSDYWIVQIFMQTDPEDRQHWEDTFSAACNLLIDLVDMVRLNEIHLSVLEASSTQIRELEQFILPLGVSTLALSNTQVLRNLIRDLRDVTQYLLHPEVELGLRLSALCWLDCDASSCSELGPCTQLPAGEEMSCCGKCLAVRYYSRAHQKAYWKTHKPLCFKPTW